MKKRTNERNATNKRTNEQMNETQNKRTNEQTNEWTKRKTNEQSFDQTEGKSHGQCPKMCHWKGNGFHMEKKTINSKSIANRKVIWLFKSCVWYK